MTTAEGVCQCGCSSMTDVTNAAEPCGCGCACCDGKPQSKEEQIHELRRLRESVDSRLAELEGS